METDGDVPIIRDVLGRIKTMLSVEHIPVVANLRWETLESLLKALCEQIQAQGQQLYDQGLRLSKAEEQDKRLSDLEAELNACKDAANEFRQDKAKALQGQESLLKALEQQEKMLKAMEQLQSLLKSLEEQQAQAKMFEQRLSGMQAGLDANNVSLRGLEKETVSLRRDLTQLQSLLPRVEALEGGLGRVNAATANLQQAFRAVDFARLAKLGSSSSSRAGSVSPPVSAPVPAPPVGPAASSVADSSATSTPAGDAEATAVLLPSGGELLHNIAGGQSNEFVGGFDSSLLAQPILLGQTDRLPYLEEQIEELRQLIQQITKAQTLDLDKLRKAYKSLRQDFEVKSLMSLDVGDENEDKSERQVPFSRLEAAIAELQSRLLRKADVEALEGVSNDIQILRDSIEQLGGSMRIKPSRPTVARGASSEILEARLTKAEDELLALATSKADLSALEALQLKLSLGGSVEPQAQVGDVGGNLQGITELISKKADRSELLDLRQLLQNQASADDFKKAFDMLRELEDALQELSDRSDLTVLLAKRATQLSNPVATVSMSGDPANDELRSVLNDHARRLGEQGDMLLQLEALAENKADQATFLSLKSMIESLQKSRRSRGLSIIPEIAKENTILQQMLQEVTASLQDHDRILQQLTKSVLIMSGHDQSLMETEEEEEIDSDGIVSVSQPELDVLSDVDEAGEMSRSQTPALTLTETDELMENPPPTVSRNEPPAAVVYRSEAPTILASESRNPAEDLHVLGRSSSVDLGGPQSTQRESREGAAGSKGQQVPGTAESLEAVRTPAPRESIRRSQSARGERSEGLEPGNRRDVHTARVSVRPARRGSEENPPIRERPSTRGSDIMEPARGTQSARPASEHAARGSLSSRENVQSRGGSLPHSEEEGRGPSSRSREAARSSRSESRETLRTRESSQPPASRGTSQTPETGGNSQAPESRESSQAPESRGGSRPPESRASSQAPEKSKEYLQQQQHEHRQTQTYSEERASSTNTETRQQPSYRAEDFPASSRADKYQPSWSLGSRGSSPVARDDTGVTRAVSLAEDTGGTFLGQASFMAGRQSTAGRLSLFPSSLEDTSGFTALEVALKQRKIRAKENLKAKDLDLMGVRIDKIKELLSQLEQTKADRQALDELWQYVKANITEHAMFTGKPLLGFKCMSCEHSIEKLHPFRSDYLPTNMMPRQWLSMFTAERLFSHDKRDSSLPARAPSPPKPGLAAAFGDEQKTRFEPQQQPQHQQQQQQQLQQQQGSRNAATNQNSVNLPGPIVASMPIRK